MSLSLRFFNAVITVILLLLPLIGFSAFKLHYPFPNFSPDSFTYIETAIHNDNITLWPIGYSKFLQLTHFIITKDSFLIYTQYLLLEISIYFLIISIYKLFHLNKFLLMGLYLILSINPLIYQLANFIGADAIFTAVSIMWATHLLWSVKKPFSLLQLALHSALVLLAFSIRYNAFYYPVISISVLIWRRNQTKHKLSGTIIILVPIIVFGMSNFYWYYKQTGIGMINAFGGWQMASNALNAYSHSATIKPEILPEQFRELHTITNKHLDSLRRLKVRPDTLISTYYLWENRAPLRQFMILKHKINNPTQALSFTDWAVVSPLYFSYGIWIIKKCPLQYLQYFLWPNFKYYFIPPPEYLQIYNMQKDNIDLSAKRWFKYKTNKIRPIIKNRPIEYIPFFSIITGIVNLFFVLSMLSWLITESYKLSDSFFKNSLYVATFIQVSNFLFSISASAIVLRYQIFPLIFAITFDLIILNSIFQMAISQHPNKKLK